MVQVTHLLSRATRVLLYAGIFVLAACGGGTKESVQNNATTTKTLSVALTLVNGAGQSVTNLREGDQLNLRAVVQVRSVTSAGGRVTADTTAPAANATVQFTAAGGVVSPTSGRVLTDAQGVATVSFVAGGSLGAFNATAGATLEGATGGSASVSYQITRILVPTLTVSFEAADGSAITRLEADQPVTAVAVLTNVETSTKQGIGNTIVRFEAGGGRFEPASGSALTDANGSARVRFVPGRDAGGYTLRANAEVAGEQVAATRSFEIRRSTVPRITLSIRDEAGQPTTRIVAGTTARIQARVEGVSAVQPRSGKLTAGPLASIPVTFATDGGVFDPTAATVLTDGNGVAEVRFLSNLVAGGFRLSATASVPTTGAEPERVEAALPYSLVVPRLVLGSGNPFAAGTLALERSPVAAGQSVQITGEIRTEAGGLYTLPANVTFRSTCAAGGGATLISPVVSSGGVFRTTYRPSGGCTGTDRVVAEASIAGQAFPLQASVDVPILPPLAQTIRYVEASATDIALRGRATATRPERADVVFQVTNDAGVPVTGAVVAFSLSSIAGGHTLLAPTAVTDVNGRATATLISGTAAASLRVIATLSGTNISAQSEAIVVSTGTPDQNSFSLSVSTFNIEAFNIDGVSTTLTIRAADHFNNPPADGTRVAFTTEGGVIPSSCTLLDGVCSVSLRSQQPRPADGRVTVLVSAPGDESFTDVNGNGRYDAGEPFQDLPEAFRDDDEDGQHDAGEPFLDRNGNGVRDPGNGVYDGALCPGVGGCQQLSTVDVRAQAVIVFSTSSALIGFTPFQVTVDELSPRPVLVSVSDLNGNLPPEGTTINITATNGELLTEGSFTVGNSNARGPLSYTVFIIGDGEPSVGVLNVEVRTPGGTVTLGQMTVTDVSFCATAPLPLPPGCDQGDAAVTQVAVNPNQFTVQAGDTARAANVGIGIFGGTSGAPRPYAGVVPVVTCDATTASGISITVDPISPTGSDGLTTARFVINAGQVPTGTVTCAVRAGEVSTPVRFVAAPPIIDEIVLTPTAVQVSPGLAGAVRTVQAAVYRIGPGMLRTPIPGVAVTVVCNSAGANGFSVLTPVNVEATSNQGVTLLNFTLNSNAMPAGNASCNATAGNRTATVTFAP